MASGTGSRATLTLNGALVELAEEATLVVGRQPYVYKDDLDRLRAAHRGTHFFKREGNAIVSTALTVDAEILGDEQVSLKAKDSVPLVGALVLEALLRYFNARGRKIWRYKPLRVVTDRPDDQLLRRVLPKGVQIPTWVEQRVAYDFDIRKVYPEGRPPVSFLSCDVKTIYEITAPCSELIQSGIDLTGRYVQIRENGDDSRLTARPKLVGRVERLEGDQFILVDHVDGYSKVSIANTFLEPRLETVSWLINQLAPAAASNILDRLDALSAEITRGPERLRRVETLFTHLRSIDLEIAPGVPFRLGPLLRSANKNDVTTWFPSHNLLNRPALIFDPGRRRTDVWNERGLDKHGPYDQNHFTPKRPNIVVVCEASRQGEVEQFVRKFLDGMPEVRSGQRRPYERGFTRRYLLEQGELMVFPIPNQSVDSYRSACRAAIEHATSFGKEWNLAIVQINEESHSLRGSNDPYLVTKSIFMKHQIPVQEVTIEKMTAPASDLAFILNDISLAAYAKLGGTPWLLPADSTIAHELVIGLGSYSTMESRLGTVERFVGITTVFSGDGRYFLESRTAVVPYTEYTNALLDTLRSAIELVRKDQNWRATDAIRLIFHAFKPLKDTEANAVSRLMVELGLPNAQFAFLHVVNDSPYVLFDESNQGVMSRGIAKGTFAPERGTVVRLSRDETLLTLTSARELKQVTDGLPRPILLRLHRQSTFKDMTYLTRQVFAFSCQSWRGFGLASMPVTILYSQLIARILNKLTDVPDWDPDAMLGKIGRTRWFL